ncbi:MAG: 6-carboxytetrahydropterin synthase QueD [Candidatus Altiarchaeota archaeon]
MRLCREFIFDAAHYIPDYKGECEKLHGHTYKLEITVEGKVGKDGMVMDFSALKNVVEENVLGKLDHQNLNDVMDNPTAENIVEWIHKRLEKKLPLYSIRLWEGDGKWVERQCA